MWQLLKKWILTVYFAFFFIINSFVPSIGNRIQVIGHSVLFKVRLCSSKLSLRLTPKCQKASLLHWVVPLPGRSTLPSVWTPSDSCSAPEQGSLGPVNYTSMTNMHSQLEHAWKGNVQFFPKNGFSHILPSCW